LDDYKASLSKIDTSTPHPARRYNYFLGGKDNFAADRESGEELARAFPGVRESALANRAVLQRIVRYLAAEAGVRQFLDIGTGLPTADNTHQVAQAVAPTSRIVYVDNDPLVLTHARALLTSSDEGATAYIEADIREPDTILHSAILREVLDLTQPVAVMLIAVLHFIQDDNAVNSIVQRLTDALPSGGFLAVTHTTWDLLAPEVLAQVRAMTDADRVDAWPRTRDQIQGFFDGLDLIDPGVVPTTQWRPDPDTVQYDLRNVAAWAAVGRKR
jgi:trans-aconitate methyltransferase